ncbi:unnamed protein product, partial [Thlaspi arvense]
GFEESLICRLFFQSTKWVSPRYRIHIGRSTALDLAPVKILTLYYVYVAVLCILTLYSSHGLIRKHGLNCCRQCFCSNAKEVGFIKVKFNYILC